MIKQISLGIGVFAILGFIWTTKPPSLLEAKRGAVLFTEYCAGCHSLQALSLNRMSHDLNLKNPQTILPVLTPDSLYAGLIPALPEQDARRWFGKTPPDLTLIAKIRGKSWLQAYLSGFYNDPTRPFGANNVILTNTAMPNVLFPLQGKQTLLNAQGKGEVKRVQPGSLTPHEFEQIVQDLVTFLDYAAEPTQWQRYFVGYIVMGLFLVFNVIIGLMCLSNL